MWVQAVGLFLTAATRDFESWFLASLLLGLGTAMVYPTLIASVSDASHPSWRARSLSVCRFWRDTRAQADTKVIVGPLFVDIVH
jgi:MFS family permease